jgi:DNA-binding CsgD family transcriptional regulator
VLSLIRLHRNDLPGARDAAGVTAAQLSDVGPRQRGNWSAWAQALLLEADGELAQALVMLGECWERCARYGLGLEYPVIGPDLVRLALAAGDAGRAWDVAAAVAGVASRNEVPWITGAALRCRGLAADDAGILEAAVSACTRGPRPLQLALTCEDAGAAFARRGNMDRASQFLDQAITIYERLDAARDLARAEAVLRQMGVRRGRHVTHSRAQSGWQSLTPSEQAVVDLVAEGLSNPQIGQRLYVSRRTVQTHLAHVFAKLHITSRAQLAAEAARHRGNEPGHGTGLRRHLTPARSMPGRRRRGGPAAAAAGPAARPARSSLGRSAWDCADLRASVAEVLPDRNIG